MRSESYPYTVGSVGLLMLFTTILRNGSNTPAQGVSWALNENAASLDFTASQDGRLRELVRDARILLQEADYHAGTVDLEIGKPRKKA